MPFVYQLQPPRVLPGEASLVFYTRELPEAAAVMDAVAGGFTLAYELPPLDVGGGVVVVPRVYGVR